MRRLSIVVFSLSLAACQTTREPPVKVVEVKVPVACDPKVSAEPAWPDTDAALKAATPERLLTLLYAGHKLRGPYIAELQAGLKGCSGK